MRRGALPAASDAAGRRRGFLSALLAAAVLLSGPAGSQPTGGLVLPGVTTLLLAGDVGEAGPGAPVPAAMARDAARRPGETLVVFLGDNVYPEGVPAPGAPSRAEAERRLFAQVDAVVASGARGLFLPGNHDWVKGAADGREALKRQEELVLARGRGRVLFLPRGGCPGPVTLDLPPRLSLVVLDTQWWLHPGPRPEGPASPCAEKTEAEVAAALAVALRPPPGGQTILLAHHPPASGGEHGGLFGAGDHLLPLTSYRKWLVVPLPLIGSAYPLLRKAGLTTVQDLASGPYRKMLAALAPALSAAPPVLYAAGHEHTLQVLERPVPGVPLLAIVGAGSPAWLTTPHRIDSTRFLASGLGYGRLTAPASGPLRLEMVSVDGAGNAVVADVRTLPPPVP